MEGAGGEEKKTRKGGDGGKRDVRDREDEVEVNGNGR